MTSFLIVDRDRAFREALAIALRIEGHGAAAVGDAGSARAALSAAPVDCCLVDAYLPGADAVIEAARVAGARALATGPHPDLLAAFAARHPHAGILAKPIGIDDLVAALPGGRRAAG